MGQSRSMHGAQSGGCRMILPVGPNGRVVSGFVGPKMTSVGVPTAAPMCAGPVSFVINTSANLMSAATSATEVLPVSTSGELDTNAATLWDTSISPGDPINATIAPVAFNLSVSSAYRSAGQRFARLLTDPGQRSTNGLL